MLRIGIDKVNGVADNFAGRVAVGHIFIRAINRLGPIPEIVGRE